MNLGQLAAFAAAKLGVSNTTTTNLAKDYAKARWRMIWDAANWRQARHKDVVAVSSGTQDVTLPEEFEFAQACRWGDNLELLPLNDLAALASNAGGFDAAGPVLSFTLLSKDSDGNARIRLFQVPEEAKNLLVLGKRKCVELASDSDTPLIPGVEQCLLAFVMGDLYQWMRQFAKAEAFFAEAQAHLQKMIEIETAQATELRRIIPVEQILDGDTHHDWLTG